jgi:hypothetical protein
MAASFDVHLSHSCQQRLIPTLFTKDPKCMPISSQTSVAQHNQLKRHSYAY